jgi:hypothetical protein
MVVDILQRSRGSFWSGNLEADPRSILMVVSNVRCAGVRDEGGAVACAQIAFTSPQ